MLRLEGVQAGYGARTVLDGLNLALAQGDRVALIGHNGAGKSTILKAITGQIRPTGGTITFVGERIDGLAPETLVARGVVQVPAGRRVFPQLTVRQNLLVGAFSRRDKDAVAADYEKMLADFPVLRAKARQRAGHLSGGEQQMLAIGRGLMARPKVLLVDEPSLGLSPVMTDQVFDLLGRLTHEGITLVLAEQNVRKALATTDRVVVLSLGAIVAEMPSERLLTEADFRRAYLAAE